MLALKPVSILAFNPAADQLAIHGQGRFSSLVPTQACGQKALQFATYAYPLVGFCFSVHGSMGIGESFVMDEYTMEQAIL